MTLSDYLGVLRRRWVLILATTCLAAILGALYTLQATRIYTSTAQLFISTSSSGTSSDAYQGNLYSQARTQSYADMLHSLKLGQRVVDDLHLKIPANSVVSKITAIAAPNTVLLNVSVADPDPAEARRINQSVVKQLQAMIAEVETPPGEKVPLVKATVIDPPRLPSAPSSPQPTRNIGLATLLGLLLGFGLAVARELLDTSVKRLSDVPGMADVPLLASLPHDPEVAKKPLISELDSAAPRVEAFRVLRTNLQFLDVDAPSKTFVITSSIPSEGKTTTSVNLAVSLAQSKQRVLLIDADMRRPKVADLLGLETTVGLTTVLVGKINFAEAVQTHRQSGLDVLTAGALPPNPAELIQSRTMKELLAQIRERYDIVLIDAPPLLPVTDSALLASETDGALLVIRHGKTNREQVQGSAERLHAVEAPILGAVINQVPRHRHMFGRGYGGYGYGYAPTETNKAAKPGKAAKRSPKPKKTAKKAAVPALPVTATTTAPRPASESAMPPIKPAQPMPEPSKPLVTASVLPPVPVLPAIPEKSAPEPLKAFDAAPKRTEPAPFAANPVKSYSPPAEPSKQPEPAQALKPRFAPTFPRVATPEPEKPTETTPKPAASPEPVASKPTTVADTAKPEAEKSRTISLFSPTFDDTAVAPKTPDEKNDDKAAVAADHVPDKKEVPDKTDVSVPEAKPNEPSLDDTQPMVAVTDSDSNNTKDKEETKGTAPTTFASLRAMAIHHLTELEKSSTNGTIPSLLNGARPADKNGTNGTRPTDSNGIRPALEDKEDKTDDTTDRVADTTPTKVNTSQEQEMQAAEAERVADNKATSSKPVDQEDKEPEKAAPVNSVKPSVASVTGAAGGGPRLVVRRRRRRNR